MSNYYRHKAEKPRLWQITLLALMVLVLSVSVWALFNTVKVHDWYVLSMYNPPKQIVDLTNEDTMTAYAKKLFYVNKPQILNKQQFAKECPNSIEQAYVIGCYHGGDNGIFLLDVNDPRLNGIIPVTAAYEMLHAGYARLSSTERNSLDKQMWAFYTSKVTAPQIKSQMAAYAVSEPGARYDELYSVLGTEVMTLPTSLENHFKIYFTNRKHIVTMYEGYQYAFMSRQESIRMDDARLSTMKEQITSQDAQLSSLLSQINANKTELVSEFNQGNYDTYNSHLPMYNQLVDQYNSLADKVRTEIDQYNMIVNQRNSLSLEEQQLVQDINSTPKTLIKK